MQINDDAVGRSVDETIRLIEGFKYADKPSNWIQGMHLEKSGEVNIYKRESTEKWMEEIIKITQEA